MSLLEWIAAVIAFTGVYLSTCGRISSWPFGIAGSMLYTWIFYQNSLPAEAALQFLYVIMGIYGWWNWSVMGSRPEERPVRRMSFFLILLSLLIWIVAAFAAGWVIQKLELGTLPYIDATLATGGLVTTLLLARKYLENWVLWIVIDLASAMLLYTREMFASSLLYFAFTILAFKGYLEWKKQCTP
jgi:nicotinamide mononucleotide transporter